MSAAFNLSLRIGCDVAANGSGLPAGVFGTGQALKLSVRQAAPVTIQTLVIKDALGRRKPWSSTCYAMPNE
jgi:hypothetical protein